MAAEHEGLCWQVYEALERIEELLRCSTENSSAAADEEGVCTEEKWDFGALRGHMRHHITHMVLSMSRCFHAADTNVTDRHGFEITQLLGRPRYTSWLQRPSNNIEWLPQLLLLLHPFEVTIDMIPMMMCGQNIPELRIMPPFQLRYDLVRGLEAPSVDSYQLLRLRLHYDVADVVIIVFVHIQIRDQSMVVRRILIELL